MHTEMGCCFSVWHLRNYMLKHSFQKKLCIGVCIIHKMCIYFHLGDSPGSELIVNPKSYSFTVVFSTLSPIVYCASSFPYPVRRHLHFPKLNSICHFLDQSVTLFRSSCNCCLFASLLIFLNTFVSSANFNTLLVISSYKSLIYIY